jgi:hypothetical protein
MSNVEGRTFYEKIEEWSVPLRDGKCTARDVSDLMRTAWHKVEARDPKLAQFDDAFMVEADEDSLKVQIRSEWKP